MHSSRMRTAHFSGRLWGREMSARHVCPGVSAGVGGGVSATNPLQPVDRQTPVKILPCSKLRLRAVNIYLIGVINVFT